MNPLLSVAQVIKMTLRSFGVNASEPSKVKSRYIITCGHYRVIVESTPPVRKKS